MTIIKSEMHAGWLARAASTLPGIALALVLAGVAPPPAGAQEAFQAVPKASCGADDRTETVQGQVTLAERFARGPAAAFNCNLELVGQYKGDGAGWGLAAAGDCAYLSTYYIEGREPKLENPGTVVLDVADPANPKYVTTLTSLAMTNVNESLDLSPDGRILFGNLYAYNPTTEFPVEFYDVSDCRNPKLLSSTTLPELRIHGGAYSPDGSLYYGTSCCGTWQNFTGPDSAIYAIDIADPANPKEIGRWMPEDDGWKTHWLSVNPEGTRAYISLIDSTVDGPLENGIVILDTSDFQEKKADPQFRLVSSMLWEDTGFGEFNLPFASGGRNYLLHTDMLGTLSWAGGPLEPTACKPGRSGWGYARIIDITDDTQPETVSRLGLEVHDPARCEDIAHDPVLSGGYSAAFCEVDRPTDPRLMACGYMEGGLRVFDIRDVKVPKEVAYFKPPATRGEPSPASFHLVGYPLPINTADSVIVPIFRDGARVIWFNTMDNGFMAVKFSDAFIAANADLFAD
jgi:hypothetical protein